MTIPVTIPRAVGWNLRKTDASILTYVLACEQQVGWNGRPDAPRFKSLTGFPERLVKRGLIEFLQEPPGSYSGRFVTTETGRKWLVDNMDRRVAWRRCG